MNQLQYCVNHDHYFLCLEHFSDICSHLLAYLVHFKLYQIFILFILPLYFSIMRTHDMFQYHSKETILLIFGY